MAYNPSIYAPAFTYPYGYQQPTTGMQYGAYQNNVYQNMSPATDIVKVAGMEGANAYPMGPNQKAVVFDSREDVMYFITTDGGGYKSIQDFDFFPRHHGKQEQTPQANYVTREDFEELVAKVDKLDSRSLRPSKSARRASDDD